MHKHHNAEFLSHIIEVEKNSKKLNKKKKTKQKKKLLNDSYTKLLHSLD